MPDRLKAILSAHEEPTFHRTGNHNILAHQCIFCILSNCHIFNLFARMWSTLWYKYMSVFYTYTRILAVNPGSVALQNNNQFVTCRPLYLDKKRDLSNLLTFFHWYKVPFRCSRARLKTFIDGDCLSWISWLIRGNATLYTTNNQCTVCYDAFFSWLWIKLYGICTTVALLLVLPPFISCIDKSSSPNCRWLVFFFLRTSIDIYSA